MGISNTTYKQTELGLIPQDWEVKNLLESFTLKARIGWQGLTTSEYLQNGEYCLVTGTDFENGYIDWDNCVYVDRKRFIQDKNIQLVINDILVTKDGTIGKVAFIDKLPNPTTLNSGIFVIRPKKERVDNRFFYYLLMSFYFDNFLSKITAGSTITHLYQKDFGTFNFIYPPFVEQTAIANALSDIDNLIEGLEKLIAKKKLIKQGALQKLLKPKKGWKEFELGNICEIFKGSNLSKSKTNSNGGNYRCILYGDLFTTYTEVIRKVNLFTNFAEGINSKKGDILFPGSTTTKGIDLAKSSTILLDNVRLGGDIIILRKKQFGYNSIFLTYFINQEKKNEIGNLAKGITIHHLYGSDLKGLKVCFPTLEEQEEIADILTDMDNEIELLQNKLNKYQQVKQGMMQNLLTGKIRLLNTESEQTKVAKPIEETKRQVIVISMTMKEHRKKRMDLYRTKAEKIVSVIQPHFDYDLGRKAYKNTGGSVHFEHIVNDVEPLAIELKCFGVEEVYFEKEGKQYLSHKYVVKENFETLLNEAEKEFGTDYNELKRIVTLFSNLKDMHEAEIKSTVYVAWNNLIIRKERATPNNIVTEARENWDKAKLKFDRIEFYNAIDWLKENNLVPKGLGKEVKKKR